MEDERRNNLLDLMRKLSLSATAYQEVREDGFDLGVHVSDTFMGIDTKTVVPIYKGIQVLAEAAEKELKEEIKCGSLFLSFDAFGVTFMQVDFKGEER